MNLRAGEVADAAGVNRETLRYYERRGILAEPERSLGGHRLYPLETVSLLRTVKAAQHLGFTLDEVADLLDTTGPRHGRGSTSTKSDSALASRARTKLDEVDAKIRDLETIRDTLRATIDAGCADLIACSTEPCCPIPFTNGVATCHPNLLATDSPAAGCCHKD